MTQEDLKGRFQQVIDKTVDGKLLLKMAMRDRVGAMAKLGRELILNAIGEFFVAAVVTATDVVFPANVISDDDHKEEIKNGVISLANERNALCLIVVMDAWGIKGTPENFQPYLRHSEHPNRQEVLMVDAKDYFEHLGGFQFIRRSGKKVAFDEFQIGLIGQSWLNEWQVQVPTTTAC